MFTIKQPIKNKINNPSVYNLLQDACKSLNMIKRPYFREVLKDGLGVPKGAPWDREVRG